jgi:hypothetical protein
VTVALRGKIREWFLFTWLHVSLQSSIGSSVAITKINQHTAVFVDVDDKEKPSLEQKGFAHKDYKLNRLASTAPTPTPVRLFS